MILETKRLSLRKMTVDDLEAVHAFMGDPEVMEFSKNGPNSIEETKEYIQNFGPKSYEKYGFGHWLIVHKEDKKVIGFAGLAVFEVDGTNEIELGFRFLKDYWGRGLASEITEAVRNYAFDKLALNHFISIIEGANTRSLRVAEKLGMKYEKDSIMFGKPVRIYSLSKY